MAVQSIKQRTNAMGIGVMAAKELYLLLKEQDALLQAVLAKLDADAGVTDTDYAALRATYIKD